MSFTSPALRAARRQCREERMRQGLDRHLVNEGEVAERAAIIERQWQRRERDDLRRLGMASLRVRMAAIGR